MSARPVPFSFSFPSPIGSDEFKIGIRRYAYLRSLTVEIEDDGLGPILINAYILVETTKKHQLKDPEIVFDGDGDNAQRFNWTGSLPLSTILGNELVISYTNYTGNNIDSVRVSGSVQR